MRNEKGFSLLEVLIALAVLAIISVGVFGSLSTTSKVVLNTDVRETAKNLAEKQMEYIKGLPFTSSYSPATAGSEYNGYTATIDVAPLEDNYIQKIVVSINWSGRQVTSLEGYKVK